MIYLILLEFFAITWMCQSLSLSELSKTAICQSLIVSESWITLHCHRAVPSLVRAWISQSLNQSEPESVRISSKLTLSETESVRICFHRSLSEPHKLSFCDQVDAAVTTTTTCQSQIVITPYISSAFRIMLHLSLSEPYCVRIRSYLTLS